MNEWGADDGARQVRLEFLGSRFAARWDSAKAQGTERLDKLLTEAAGRTLDPEICEAAEDLPKPTIGEAIQIARLMRADGQPGGGRAGAAWPRRRSLDEVRDSILTKLSAIDRRRSQERLAQGWVQDEAENWIPPGWERSRKAG